MADNNNQEKDLNGFKHGGTLFKFKQIFEQLGITFEQFCYLLDRDFYAPHISFAPTPDTIAYNDPVMGLCNFRIGQPVVYDVNGVRKASILIGNTAEGKAVWQEIGGTISTATIEHDGLMSAADKQKLDNINVSWDNDTKTIIFGTHIK